MVSDHLRPENGRWVKKKNQIRAAFKERTKKYARSGKKTKVSCFKINRQHNSFWRKIKKTDMNVEVKKNEHKKTPYVYCFIVLLSVHKFKFWVFNKRLQAVSCMLFYNQQYQLYSCIQYFYSWILAFKLK